MIKILVNFLNKKLQVNCKGYEKCGTMKNYETIKDHEISCEFLKVFCSLCNRKMTNSDFQVIDFSSNES